MQLMALFELDPMVYDSFDSKAAIDHLRPHQMASFEDRLLRHGDQIGRASSYYLRVGPLATQDLIYLEM